MMRRISFVLVGVVLASGVGPVLPAGARTATPNPCKLLTVHQIDKYLHEGHQKPELGKTHSRGTRQCGWQYSDKYLVLTVGPKPANPSGRCKSGAKPTPVPSLGPDGALCRDNRGGPAGSEPETTVYFTRHSWEATLYVSRKLNPATPLIKLAKIVYREL